MEKEYKYYYNDIVFRVADGQTERYEGNGVWEKTEYNPQECMDSTSPEYDFGETAEETPEEAERLMKCQDEDIKRLKENGWDE